MDFVTIDFETAGVYRDSACEIGLTFVENSEITETKSWLIKPNCWPDFNPYAIEVHGIEPDDVIDAPDFAELWPEIKPLINGRKLIAHNASFDFGVLRESLNTYKLEYPVLEYACSYIFAKQAWPGQYSYALNYLCHINGIVFNHHRATAELSLKAFKEYDIEKFEDLSDVLLTRIGSMSQGKHSPCHTKRDYSKKVKLDMSKFSPDPKKEDPDSIFYQKKIVFTGTLNSMARRDAFQTIVDIGGHVTESLTKDVDFLIVGQHNYAVIDATSGLSGKQKKAASFAGKGYPIEIVSENFFTRNI